MQVRVVVGQNWATRSGQQAAVFNAFATQFRRDILCAEGACQLFTPISNDAYAEALSRISCTGHRFIHVASLAFARDAVAQQLVRLRHAGCTVRVLLEHAPTPAARARAAPTRPCAPSAPG